MAGRGFAATAARPRRPSSAALIRSACQDYGAGPTSQGPRPLASVPRPPPARPAGQGGGFILLPPQRRRGGHAAGQSPGAPACRLLWVGISPDLHPRRDGLLPPTPPSWGLPEPPGTPSPTMGDGRAPWGTELDAAPGIPAALGTGKVAAGSSPAATARRGHRSRPWLAPPVPGGHELGAGTPARSIAVPQVVRHNGWLGVPVRYPRPSPPGTHPGVTPRAAGHPTWHPQDPWSPALPRDPRPCPTAHQDPPPPCSLQHPRLPPHWDLRPWAPCRPTAPPPHGDPPLLPHRDTGCRPHRHPRHRAPRDPQLPVPPAPAAPGTPGPTAPTPRGYNGSRPTGTQRIPLHRHPRCRAPPGYPPHRHPQLRDRHLPPGGDPRLLPQGGPPGRRAARAVSRSRRRAPSAARPRSRRRPRAPGRTHRAPPPPPRPGRARRKRRESPGGGDCGRPARTAGLLRRRPGPRPLPDTLPDTLPGAVPVLRSRGGPGRVLARSRGAQKHGAGGARTHRAPPPRGPYPKGTRAPRGVPAPRGTVSETPGAAAAWVPAGGGMHPASPPSPRPPLPSPASGSRPGTASPPRHAGAPKAARRQLPTAPTAAPGSFEPPKSSRGGSWSPRPTRGTPRHLPPPE
ncbi:basic proline-rich protein-like [Harpia harpyja]|uniref:basic proline-rich protein-like n=1 Tax=Harpia harpyja TaxID=202280 RepID=UPI0022B1B527|nr:basic proline-rich protein-like [Harpia harpyja]